MYRMYKNVNFCKKTNCGLIQVFHIKNTEKGGKTSVFHNLSTLSTLKGSISVDYSGIKKEQMFCELVIKITFCRKKVEKILTFE